MPVNASFLKVISNDTNVDTNNPQASATLPMLNLACLFIEL
jgi:hypothetical protein